MGNYIKAGILSGIILFVWGFFSWMVLPWHHTDIKEFKSEVAIEQAIQANVPVSGIYFMPNMHTANADVKPMQNQPMIFASVVLTGVHASMAMPMLINLLSVIVAATLVAWMLSRTYRLGYINRVGFVVLFALAATIIRDLPLWNWFGFDLHFTLVNMADVIIGWLFAGLVLAKIVKGRQ